MKLNAVTSLDVDVDVTDVYLEIGGKEVAAGKARQVTENGRTRVVLVPVKSRVRASRAKDKGKVVRITDDEIHSAIPGAIIDGRHPKEVIHGNSDAAGD